MKKAGWFVSGLILGACAILYLFKKSNVSENEINDEQINTVLNEEDITLNKEDVDDIISGVMDNLTKSSTINDTEDKDKELAKAWNESLQESKENI